IKNLAALGFSNISVDLILGVPGENVTQIVQSVNKLAELKVPHQSTYLLTIEEKTTFYKRIKAGNLIEATEDEQVNVYRCVQNELLSLGYKQYDISSYGLLGHFSRHNQVYWAKGCYMGVGPGAHSMRLIDGGIERAHCSRPLKEWLLKPGSNDNFSFDRLNQEQALKESLAFGLRNMYWGIDISELSRLHHCQAPKGLGPALEKMSNFGWLEEEKGRMRITKEGALFADAIMSEILSC
ncbi:MAG TPA: hypothetical protein VEK06_04700, partial [Myxococcota bacterium]|nr:hypothetical protein [Myxococcota bacterium]